jgi:hypothetical protein
VFAAPDDPVAIDEALALSLVILGPAAPHSGKGVAKSIATDAVSETLMRCRSSQRHARNTLLFIAADEANLGTAREVIAKAMAWASIIKDDRLQQQMTKAADAADKAKTHSDGARRALRTAWSHIFYPTKSETPGKPFDLEHSLISARDRAAIPVVVYEKAKGDGIALEKLGADRFWHALKPIWPEGKPHLRVAEIADGFATYVYLPKLRDHVVRSASTLARSSARSARAFVAFKGRAARMVVVARRVPGAPAEAAAGRVFGDGVVCKADAGRMLGSAGTGIAGLLEGGEVDVGHGDIPGRWWLRLPLPRSASAERGVRLTPHRHSALVVRDRSAWRLFTRTPAAWATPSTSLGSAIAHQPRHAARERLRRRRLASPHVSLRLPERGGMQTNRAESVVRHPHLDPAAILAEADRAAQPPCPGGQ